MALSAAKLFDISGKVAVVTGGGRGIGAMIAETLVQNGCKVYVTSRSVESCEEALERMASGPGSAIPIAQDLSSQAGCDAFAEELASREEKLHILVNNSGTTWGQPYDSYPEKAWDRCFDLNVKGVFSLTRALTPLLASAGDGADPARVVNVGSIAGIAPQPIPTFAYDASKAAVHMLTKKLATELAPKHINVNAIAPGFVPSDMSKQLLTYAKKESIERAVPCGRMGGAGDMGGAVVFLSSEAGSWVNGVILPVDGGTTAKAITMVEE